GGAGARYRARPAPPSSSLRARPRLLADLAPDDLVRVLDALALVGVGLAQHPQARRRLAEDRLVRPAQRDRRLLVDLRRDALGQRKDDGVGVAQRELDGPALQLRAIADPDDLELPLEAVLDAADHVGDERPREAVERAHLAVVSRPGDDEHVVLHLRAEPRGDRLGELALGTLGSAGRAVHLDLHALRDGDGFPADP